MSTATAALQGATTARPIGGNSEAPMLDPKVRHYDEVIRKHADVMRYGWFDLGEAATTINTKELWKQYAAPDEEEPFHSFEDYVNRRAGKSRTAIYRAIQLYTGLSQSVGTLNCKRMTQANAIWMLRLGKRIGEKKAYVPEIIKAALDMQEKPFAEYCNEKLPGAAKEEQKQNITFSGCDKSLAKVVDKAVQVAQWESELDDKRDALERIVTFFLESLCEKEGYSKLSNQQAYAKAAGRKRK